MVFFHAVPSNVDDYCLTPSGDGCGKEQGLFVLLCYSPDIMFPKL